MCDEQSERREWIAQRIEQLATRKGVRLDGIEFHSDPRGVGDILAFRVDGHRVTTDVTATTLDDLAGDAGEQARMERVLRALFERARDFADE
jgi:hypothetical protein